MANPELSRPEFDERLLVELQPVIGTLVDEHFNKSKDWYPHQLVPYDDGRTFERGYEWQESDTDLPKAVRSALFVNLLTEDNLPYYFQHINSLFGEKEAWRTWSHRWTAEEGRHATVIRDYLTVRRAVDPVLLEDGRMAQVSLGEVPTPLHVLDGLAYVTMQELATRVAHRNSGQLLDKAGNLIMARVAGDEFHHHRLYLGLTAAALALEPAATLEALERQIKHFEMPGTGIPGFRGHAARIAKSGIYGLPEFALDVVKPTLDSLGVDTLTGLPREAEHQLERLQETVATVYDLADKQEQARQRSGQLLITRAIEAA